MLLYGFVCLLPVGCTNLELGESVSEYIFELDLKIHAPYVILSNIYDAAARWRDIEKVWTMMKYRGIKMTHGCSWIEVNKKVHTFLLGEGSHSQMQEIYTRLKTLACHSKVAGYVLNEVYAE